MSDADNLEYLGAYLEVLIELPEDLANQFQAEPSPVPTPISGNAIIDTGSPITCIDIAVAEQLKLNPVGLTDNELTFGGETKKRPKYPVRVSFPGTRIGVVFFQAAGLPLASNISKKGPIETKMIIGRDMLKDFIFIYDGPRGICELRRRKK